MHGTDTLVMNSFREIVNVTQNGLSMEFQEQHKVWFHLFTYHASLTVYCSHFKGSLTDTPQITPQSTVSACLEHNLDLLIAMN